MPNQANLTAGIAALAAAGFSVTQATPDADAFTVGPDDKIIDLASNLELAPGDYVRITFVAVTPVAVPVATGTGTGTDGAATTGAATGS